MVALAGVLGRDFTVVAGLCAWTAGLLLWVDVPRKTKIQSAILLLVGVLGILFGVSRQQPVPLHEAIGVNAPLIAMLAAVSFLRLITAPPEAAAGQAPSGTRSLASTLAGVHFFGAVVNLSTIFIMARRMSHHDRLTRQQYMTLVRGFSSAAFWSPFFAAMAAALTYAPGARLPLLLGFGLPLALIALALTFRDVSRLGVDDFEGYPMRLSSLWLPGLLAILILGAHAWRPDISVLGLIALLAPVVTLLTLLVRRRPLVPVLGGHLRYGLPAMRAELMLFLAAGVMAAGLMLTVQVSAIGLPFSHFGAWEAALLVMALVTISVLGVHPVIGIAAGASLVAPVDPDPTLLASSFLAAWAIGVAVSPLSAMNLGLQGAYGIRPLDILRWNLPFGIAMVLVTSALFFLHPSV